MKGLTLAAKYALFALIATAINMGSQKLIYIFFDAVSYGGFFYRITGIVAGTGTGLIAKYILDKRYIFYYEVESAKQNMKTFMLYTVMGIVTTVIFWGFELAFDRYLDFDGAWSVGGIIGLSIGYTTKYFLDRRFVFTGEQK
jgi:putative flippase GtrA